MYARNFLVHLLEISIGLVMVVRDMGVSFRHLYPCAGIGLWEVSSAVINIRGEESVGFEKLSRDPCLVKRVLKVTAELIHQCFVVGPWILVI
jgi:hypothetical protein